MSEQFKKSKENHRKMQNRYPQTHKHMAASLPDSLQVLQSEMASLSKFYLPKPSLSVTRVVHLATLSIISVAPVEVIKKIR